MSITFGNTITPGADGNSLYPTHVDKYGKGGLITLDQVASISAIAFLRQSLGMLIYAQDTAMYYAVTSISSPLTGYTPLISLSGGLLKSSLANVDLGQIPSLSGNWNSVYTSVCSNSANWQSAYNTLNSLSGNWQNTYSSLQNLSGNWQNSYNTVNSLSSNWQNAISTINGTANQIIATASGNNTYTLGLANDITIPGNFIINGTFTANGSATFINTNNLVVNDNIIYINQGATGNTLDTGFVSHFTPASGNYNHTGLIRKAGQGTPGIWTLFSGLTTEPLTSSNINWSDATLKLDTLSANIATPGGNSDNWNYAYNTVNVINSDYLRDAAATGLYYARKNNNWVSFTPGDVFNQTLNTNSNVTFNNLNVSNSIDSNIISANNLSTTQANVSSLSSNVINTNDITATNYYGTITTRGLGLIPFPSNAQNIPNNIMAYWSFNASSGENPLYDNTGNGNTLTNTNATLVDGIFNGVQIPATTIYDGAYLFDNTSLMIAQHSNAYTSFDFSQDFAISFWIKPSALSNSLQPLIVGENYSDSYNNYEYGGIGIGLQNNRIVLNDYIGDLPSISENLTTSIQLSSDVWSHVVVTRTTGLMSIYINGVSVAEQASIGNYACQEFVIGGLSTSFLNYIASTGQLYSLHFNGLLDEIGIWLRGLTSNEITAIYNNGDGSTYPFTYKWGIYDGGTIDTTGYGAIEFGNDGFRTTLIGTANKNITVCLPSVSGTLITDTILDKLSGSWQNTYNTVNSLSNNWQSTYTTVRTNSALWGSQGTNLNQLSGNWQNTYNTVNSLSGNWQSVYNTTKNLSGNWQNTYNTVNSLSGNWQNTYNTVSSLSGNWQNTYNTVSSLSGNWQNTYNTVNSLSGNWSAAYTTLSTRPYTYISSTSSVLPLFGNNAVTQTTTTTSISSGLLAYWPLDDSSWTDSTGNGYTLTNNSSATVGTGILNGDAVFNGSNYFSNNSLTLSTFDFSFSLWVKQPTLSNKAILSQGISSGNALSGGYIFSINSFGYPTFNAEQKKFITATNAIIPNTWSHIAVTSRSGIINIYTNGVQSVSGTYSANYNTAPFTIGYSGFAGSFNFIGQLDEIGVWNRALSQTEISYLYNNGRALAYPLTVFGGSNNYILGGTNNVIISGSNNFILGSNLNVNGNNTVFVNNLSSNSLVYDAVGNSNQWNSVYTFVTNNSSSWANATVSLPQSANWNSVYNTVNSLSGNWQNAYSLVAANSSVWGTGGTTSVSTSSYIFTGNGSTSLFNFNTVTPLTAASSYIVSLNGAIQIPNVDYTVVYSNGTNQLSTLFVPRNGSTLSVISLINYGVVTSQGGGTYTVSLPQSANWNSVYSTVASFSGTWGSGTTDAAVRSLTGNWNNVYTFVTNNSSGWGNTTVSLPQSANWNSTYTTVCSNSANWQSAYTWIANISTQNVTFSTITGTLYGSATSANKLTNSITITLTGSIIGTASFDGSSNFTITTQSSGGSGLTSKIIVTPQMGTINSPYQTTKLQNYLIDTRLSSVAVYLPNSPQPGDFVTYQDMYKTWNNNNFIINRNTYPLQGLNEDMTCDLPGLTITLTYIDNTLGWYVD